MAAVCAVAALAAAGEPSAAAAAAAPEHHEYIVLGAGPGGLQVGRALQRDGADFLVLERGKGPGTFFHRFPIHRKLISINKRFTGSSDPEYQLRHDWNSLLGREGASRFTELTADLWPHAGLLPRYLAKFVEEHGLEANIRYSTEVTEVRKSGELFELRLGGSAEPALTCDVLIVATGRAMPHVDRSTPGWELMTDYSEVNTSARAYEGERVLIVGGGNAALEVADAIESNVRYTHLVLRTVVRLAHQTHYVGDLRAVNARVLDRYLLKSEDAFYSVSGRSWDLKRNPDGTVNFTVQGLTEDRSTRFPYDRVISCTGFRPDLSIFHPSALPALTHGGAFPKLTTAYESANVTNLFFAGNLMHGRDYKVSSGGFIHGFRYLSDVLPKVIALRRSRIPWPADSIECGTRQLAEAILGRVRVASGMYQMFKYMGDVFELPRPGLAGPCTISWYKDVPQELLTSGVLLFGHRKMTYVTLTMEWHPHFHGWGTLWHTRLLGEDTQSLLRTSGGRRQGTAAHTSEQAKADVGTKYYTWERAADQEYALRFGTPLTQRPRRQWVQPTKPLKDADEIEDHNNFLHPVLRVWRRRDNLLPGEAHDGPQDPELLASHIMEEDIFTLFDEHKYHVEPLTAFIRKTVRPLLPYDLPSDTCPEGGACSTE